MKVNLFLATVKEHPMGGVESLAKGEKLATVELEVVPGGHYVIDGVTYILADKPTFHINKKTSQGAMRSRSPFPIGHVELISHDLAEVDLLCIKQG